RSCSPIRACAWRSGCWAWRARASWRASWRRWDSPPTWERCGRSPRRASRRGTWRCTRAPSPMRRARAATRPRSCAAGSQLPAGAGLGSSAALAIAVLRALAAAAGRRLRPDEELALGRRLEAIFHGHPSGIDPAAAAQPGGGCIRFVRGEPPAIGALRTARPLPLVIALGPPRSPGAAVGGLRARWEADRVRHERLFDRVAAAGGLGARAGQAIARATQYLVATQHPHGYWHAPLEANVTMEAEYVFFNRMLGRDRPDLDRRMAERMLALQQADGSWPQYREGPGNLSTTIEAYFALELAGLKADEPALARARDFILGHGGLARAGVFTRFWLAYFGQFPWAGLPALPVELVL